MPFTGIISHSVLTLCLTVSQDLLNCLKFMHSSALIENPVQQWQRLFHVAQGVLMMSERNAVLLYLMKLQITFSVML